MLHEIWKISILLLLFFFSDVSGSFVGINIGMDITDLPLASNIMSILNNQNIKHVRLHDADHQLLTSLANTGIEVIVGVPNDQLLKIGESRREAANWINRNIAPYLPATNVTYIAVGNEVLTTIPNAALVLVPAMQFLHSALLAANLNFQVKISSPHSIDMIPKSFPPSTSTFNSSWNSIMLQYLHFLKNTNSVFMLNAQPYYGYMRGNGIFPLEYALFRSLSPNNQIVDPNTLFKYTNMFDSMVDAAYYSMQAMNFTDIFVLVTASGWPSFGGTNEPDATVDNALVYNNNLISHVLNGSGTPGKPNMPINTYIYELFNEDLKPGSISEKNWGIFSPNGTEMYNLDFVTVNEISMNSSALVGVFCVANPSADSKALKASLDWACGPGSANCTGIQPGQPCYESDNLVALASYAFNDYYHRTQANGGTCSFGSTAMISTVDPSHGSCIFAGSTGSNISTGIGGTASGPMSAISSGSRLHITMWSYLQIALLVLPLCF